MARFKFTAIDPNGKQKTGVIEAANEQEAKDKVSRMSMMPTNIAPAEDKKAKHTKKTGFTGMTKKTTSRTRPGAGGGGGGAFLGFGKVVNQEGLTIFTRQLATLLQAGLPLLRSLETLIRQERNPKFKQVQSTLAENVRSGNNLSDGMAAHPRVFDRLYVNMVRAGEAGGVLDVVLDRLAGFQEKSVKTKNKVKSAMIYPVVIITVAILIVAALMVFVVPSFQNIFDDMLQGQPLPWPTQIVINTSNFVKGNILVTLGLVAILIVGFAIFKRTTFGVKFIDSFALYTPKIGELISKANIARFTRTFGTLLSSGVPILQALLITRDVIGNYHFEKAIDRVHNRVRDGESLAAPMGREKVFPTMVSSMIDVGEETGDLAPMLNRIADNYDDDVDNAVAGITSIIEPIMIVLLALIIGFIVIALFLPIVEIINTLG
ncbi:MAG: type II secretion system F family protein [Verrucomicrobiota bacterium]